MAIVVAVDGWIIQLMFFFGDFDGPEFGLGGYSGFGGGGYFGVEVVWVLRSLNSCHRVYKSCIDHIFFSFFGIVMGGVLACAWLIS